MALFPTTQDECDGHRTSDPAVSCITCCGALNSRLRHCSSITGHKYGGGCRRTKSRAKIAALKRGWTLIEGVRKHLFVYGLWLTAAEVVDAIRGRTRKRMLTDGGGFRALLPRRNKAAAITGRDLPPMASALAGRRHRGGEQARHRSTTGRTEARGSGAPFQYGLICCRP